jgi:diaminopimelate epimerase
MPAELPVEEIVDYPLSVDGSVCRITCVLVGTPHAVIFAPAGVFWDNIPPISAQLEVHPAFPERINVTWCAVESPESLRIRTWERAVGPTLGCGSGACAALAAANRAGLAGEHAWVTSPGGSLEIDWPGRGDILMLGPARIVFTGRWPLQV